MLALFSQAGDVFLTCRGVRVCQAPESIGRTRLSAFDLLNRPPIPKAKAPFSIWPARGSRLSLRARKTMTLRPLVYQTPEPRHQVAQQQQQPQPKNK